MIRRPPRSTLFPSPTLFRSVLTAVNGQPINSMARLHEALKTSGGKPVQVEYRRDGQVQSTSISPDRKSTRLNSSHANISYAVFCLKKKNTSEIQADEYHILC